MSEILGLGSDLVRIDRIARIGARDRRLFFERVLGPEEKELLADSMDWARCARHVAAKEALFKALGSGLVDGMHWSDVELSHTAEGRAQLKVSGASGARLAALGDTSVAISLSSDRHYAMAIVILTRTGSATLPCRAAPSDE